MFGGHMANAAGRKAGKSGGGKQGGSGVSAGNGKGASAKPEVPDNIFDFLSIEGAINTMVSEEEGPPAQPSAKLSDFGLVGKSKHPHKDIITGKEVEIKYSAVDDKPLERDLIYDFWLAVGEMLLDPIIIRKIVFSAEESGRALHLAAIDFQRSVMENNFGIEPDYGCQQMGTATMNYPNDKEFHQGAAGFMMIAMHSYVEQLKARACFAILKGNLPRSEGKMTRKELMEFFEGCNATMPMARTKLRMQKVWDQAKDFRACGKVCIDIQHKMLQLVGVTVDMGIASLNSMQTDHPNDRELALKFAAFRTSAEVATNLAGLKPEDKAEFLKEVPEYLRDTCPHIYFCQKQRVLAEQAREQAMAEQQGKESPDLAENQRKILEFLSTDEGYDQVKSISTKLTQRKARYESNIKGWEQSDRMSFFETFRKRDFIQEICACGSDMTKRVTIFATMDDSDLDEVLQMQAVFNQDARSGGHLLNQLRTDPVSADVGNVMSSLGAIFRMNSIPKGTKLEMPPPRPQQQGGHAQAHGHDHSHSHDHAHGAHGNHDHSNCGHNHDHAHGHQEVGDKKPDTMER